MQLHTAIQEFPDNYIIKDIQVFNDLLYICGYHTIEEDHGSDDGGSDDGGSDDNDNGDEDDNFHLYNCSVCSLDLKGKDCTLRPVNKNQFRSTTSVFFQTPY